MLVDEQTHQLSDRNRGMGVVQLHREFFMEAGQWNLLDPQDAQHVHERAADEEVLLLQAQLLALHRLVVRVEDFAQVLGDHLLIDRAVVVAAVEDLEVEGFGGFCFPQPQRVGGIDPIAEDRCVVRNTVDDPVR